LHNREIEIKTQAAQQVGTFDVFLDDELVYSKSKTGRVPHPGEVEKIIQTRID